MPDPPRSPAGLLLALAVLLGSCSPPERPGEAPRHVLLVTVQSMRPDHMSTYLYGRPTTAWQVTPQQRADGRALSLDDLAVQGVLFAHAFAPAPSGPPSLASLLTGRSPLEHGVLDAQTPLPPGERTLAECFSDAGFVTAAFVSGELGLLGGYDQGFETWEVAGSDRQLLGRVLRWQDGQDFGDEKPRFTWIHLSGSSAPYRPESYMERPDDPSSKDWTALFADPDYAGGADGSLELLASVEGRPEALEPADLEHLVDLYDADLAETAAAVRKLLSYFTTSTAPAGVWEDTLFVFAGLHGEELFEHGRFGHGQALRDSTLWVPLFLRHPGSLTGSRILAEVVELADVAPTLLEWFHVEAEGRRSGRSLLALTDSYVKREFDSHPAFSCLGEDRLSLRTPAWRATWTAAYGGDSRGGFLSGGVSEQRPDAFGGRHRAAPGETDRSRLAGELSTHLERLDIREDHPLAKVEAWTWKVPLDAQDR